MISGRKLSEPLKTPSLAEESWLTVKFFCVVSTL